MDTRREWLKFTSGLAGLSLAGCAGTPGDSAPPRKLKVVVVGGHVDDPQAGCGGTMALYSRQGHDVVALSLTRGHSESIAKSLSVTQEELAVRRSADAVKSCDILKSRIRFLDQMNGQTVVNPETSETFARALREERPDVVFTHWPIDTHRDHRAASMLTFDAWLRGGKAFPLYFYEVESGQQTQTFAPDHYVDIGPVEEQKRDACFANEVTIKGWWPLHEAMHRFRGMECGRKAAEAFVRHAQSPPGGLP